MKPKSHSFVLCCLSLAFYAIAPAFTQAATKPNVIIIITYDQGYGEIAANGNLVIKTPSLDKLHSESIRLINFHVDPTCSPTRSALMTGRYSTRTGVWHTINGRSLMSPKELTMAEVFKSNGYATAMIGKWHLGDNYPFRPQDQGFEHTIQHLGGGSGNGADYWENDYFDDTYLTNGEWKTPC
jgi:arylsulfatase A-like enzyme